MALNSLFVMMCR